jgi:ATP-dependent RNA helicase DDX21
VPVTQASTSVQHLMLPCHWSQRNAMVPDLVRCYGACGRTIVFTETKRDANDLVTALGDSVRALHGDIPQARVPCLKQPGPREQFDRGSQ